MTSEGYDPGAPLTDAKASKRHKIAVPGREAVVGPTRTDLRLCPFLVTDSGSWRAAFPVKEHECAAVAPPVPLALDKQRRLCLTDAHRSCPAFLAGVELRERTGVPLQEPHATDVGISTTVDLASADAATIGTDPAPDRTVADRGPVMAGRGPRRPVPSTTPVLLERARSAVPGPLWLPRTSRASGQLVLIALLVVAFIAIALARFGSSGTGLPTASPVGSGSPFASASSVVVSATPSAGPTASPTPEASPNGSAAPAPSPTPSPTVRPTKPPATPRPTPSVGTRTYTVKFGDTLSSIAAHFGVTVASIQALNGIQDPRLIRPGQVLQIP